MAMSVGVAPLELLPPRPPWTPPMTVNAAGFVSRRPEQLTVMSCEPGRAFRSMVAMPLEVSLAP